MGPAGRARTAGRRWRRARFSVRLDNFEGPFDLLLTLISRRQLDVTEVALSQVTDDFIGYLKAAGDEFDLGQATEFLVVAATLLDLKAARLLPAADVEDEEDLALLEARDLLFARLLQYRAYKLAAAHLGALAKRAGRRFGRVAELEPRFAALSPELRIGVDLQQFAAIAAGALRPRPVPMVGGGTPAHAPGQRARAHDGDGRTAGPHRLGDLPLADRRLRLHAGGGGPVPRAAGALPRRRGELRSGRGAVRAQSALDRRRCRRGRAGREQAQHGRAQRGRAQRNESTSRAGPS